MHPFVSSPRKRGPIRRGPADERRWLTPCLTHNALWLWSRRSPGRRRDLNLTVIQRGQPVGLCNIVHGVGVEERIEWRRRPCHGRQLVARGPAVDLSDILDDK